MNGLIPPVWFLAECLPDNRVKVTGKASPETTRLIAWRGGTEIRVIEFTAGVLGSGSSNKLARPCRLLGWNGGMEIARSPDLIRKTTGQKHT
jgi:hypothetical protein